MPVRDPHIPGYECHNLGLSGVISKTPDNRGLILFLNNPKRPEAVGLRGMLTRAYGGTVLPTDFAVIPGHTGGQAVGSATRIRVAIQVVASSSKLSRCVVSNIS